MACTEAYGERDPAREARQRLFGKGYWSIYWSVKIIRVKIASVGKWSSVVLDYFGTSVKSRSLKLLGLAFLPSSDITTNTGIPPLFIVSPDPCETNNCFVSRNPYSLFLNSRSMRVAVRPFWASVVIRSTKARGIKIRPCRWGKEHQKL